MMSTVSLLYILTSYDSTIKGKQRLMLAKSIFLNHTTNDEMIDVELERRIHDVLLKKSVKVA